MIHIPYEVKTGQENMNIDCEILEQSIKNQSREPVFRLYGWKPYCVSLGRNQDDSFIDRNLLEKEHIDVVRRLTGGRALLHANEITYSFVCPINYLKNGQHVSSSYKEISEILINKFKSIGIELGFGNEKPINTNFDYCMLISTGADICYQNKKLIGSAQCRKNGYILQHGSILYDYDKELLEKIFKEKVSTEEITCIREINPKITKQDIINLLGES